MAEDFVLVWLSSSARTRQPDDTHALLLLLLDFYIILFSFCWDVLLLLCKRIVLSKDTHLTFIMENENKGNNWSHVL